ncbi:hypothetical protein K432DRAFT_403756 [Lepidopterella palustris CBS 459.81]|uniref:HRDC domain-containing protein n=1 Tax=Lepidopterella palustris CBS 459.81 TaxID=1314670 RepID=A0A8E2EDC2_9PEZI|nr:hypothetical protein K432DRAFT_403756 [Lepidopterella palustris CBS 459.81]
MMDLSDDFKSLQEIVSAALVSATRISTKISAEDLGFQRSLDPNIGNSLDTQNARLLSLVGRLLANAAKGSEVVAPNLRDLDAVEGNWRGVVDVIDSLLEKADTSLDEYTGVVKRLSPGQEQTPALKQRLPKLTNAFRTKDLPKPQVLFENVPQNNATGGFEPLITSKPHAKISFQDSIRQFIDEKGNQQYQHPYQSEIESYKYPTSVYTRAEPIPYQPFETTTATFVDTPEALAAMLAELKTAKEIAIDLEHHDNRSYIGLVSLMQISTRNKDWIVDTLKPWRRRLECLNEVFADPSILKVLHGAFMDIIWLQRDFGLYVVGLFDTHHAARALGYAGGSLAFLLQKFVNFNAQKQYQIADWRIRPLPAEMFDYARSDTHFLLYIYDNMRNELIETSDFSDPEKDRILRVFEKSQETALQRYEHPIYDLGLGQGPAGWYRLLSRTPVEFSKEQFSVFKAVHQWRDTVARQEDESTHYVMANHTVFSIARIMPLDKATLLGVAQPISPTVRLRAHELVATISKAKTEGANGPEMNSVITLVEGARERAPPQDAYQSLAIDPTLIVKPAPTIATLETLPLRIHSSQFWGKTFTNSIWEQRCTAATTNICLALPLPQLSAEVFADPTDVTTQDEKFAVDPGARAEHAFVGKNERSNRKQDDEVFIVKKLGGDRKRKIGEVVENARQPANVSPSSPPTNPATRSPLGDENAEADELSIWDDKGRRKAEKKAAKRLKKQKTVLNRDAVYGEQSSEGKGVEPFDYTNAPSVLHAHQNESKGGKKEKEFNPYAKALDAPKGLGRSQRESAGRSKTFK